jgi:hypothetical protein
MMKWHLWNEKFAHLENKKSPTTTQVIGLWQKK